MTEPLVLLHGFTGSPASWDEVLAGLPGRPALRLALAGHAGAPPPQPGFELEVDRLARLLPDEPVHLAGYSLGARLALALTLRHPRAVRRLTLIGVHPGLDSDSARAERRRSDAELATLLETRGLAAFLEHWENQPLFRSQHHLDAARRERKRAERLSHDPRGLAASLRSVGLAEMPDYRPQLGFLTQPLTVLAGELDEKFVSLARGVARLVPRAALVVVPGAGHDLLLERPEQVAGALRGD
ncbi:MAG TPA: alpha/beta fold hydrolase [Polyangiaceae bacterium]